MRPRVLLISAAAPALFATCVRLWCLGVAAAGGSNPFWVHEPLTLSEAAVTRDFGEVGRLLADGTDPNSRYHMRAVVTDRERDDYLTPLEAAEAGGSDEIAWMLSAAGARRTDD